eukprot:COSAG02_NODE_8652_length_2489_cov_3.862343_2_plen_166_part_00
MWTQIHNLLHPCTRVELVASDGASEEGVVSHASSLAMQHAPIIQDETRALFHCEGGLVRHKSLRLQTCLHHPLQEYLRAAAERRDCGAGGGAEPGQHLLSDRTPASTSSTGPQTVVVHLAQARVQRAAAEELWWVRNREAWVRDGGDDARRRPWAAGSGLACVGS